MPANALHHNASNTLPVILVTGASRGLGEAIVGRLSHWARVYGTTRTDHELSGCQRLELDVTDPTSVQRAVDQVLTAEGRIDVLINNAGSVLSGPSESTPEHDALRQLDVNFVGAMRMTNAVLPAMRSQRSGLILNISSTDATYAKSFESAYQRYCSDEAHGMPPANLAQRVEQIVRRPPTHTNPLPPNRRPILSTPTLCLPQNPFRLGDRIADRRHVLERSIAGPQANLPLTEAARNIVPVAVTASESVDRLRTWASGRCLDATRAGIYQKSSATSSRSSRKIVRDPSLN